MSGAVAFLFASFYSFFSLGKSMHLTSITSFVKALTGRQLSRADGRGRRGFTLVLVLASLVLLSALIIAFLSGSNTEMRASKSYAEGVSARLLAQSATSLVRSQLAEATRGVEDDLVTPQAWASQPGMIRTYDVNGLPVRSYKLYSWSNLTTLGNFDSTAAGEAVPADWYARPALFTDLNQPVRIKSGATVKSVYPIIDGNGLTYTLSGVPGVTGAKTYPNAAGTAPDIDGFWVANAPADSTAATGLANPVPMPVGWLYQLQDGTIVAPTAGMGDSINVTGASANNPIVGRFAFWTDDESCKLNINTASEGTFSDVPRVYGPADWKQGQYLAAQKEFQRYPGHPAMTSLSTVLKKPSATMTDQQWAEKLYAMLPRTKPGGSLGGTVTTPATPGGIGLKSERLFATVDEVVYSPLRTGETAGDADYTTAASGPAPLNADNINRAKFFLTANSRSPDVNQFNKPRVCIWPITLDKSSGEELKTPFDQLIAFCSTMRNDLPEPYSYYFRRQNHDSSTNDLPNAKTPAGLGRNRALLDYLRTLAGQTIPGLGGSFAAKYATSNPLGGGGTDCDQILTEIFDYIRSTNLRDSSMWTGPVAPTPSPYYAWAGEFTQNLYGYTTDVNKKVTYNALPGVGQVVPIEDQTNGTRGFGRFPTVQSGMLHFLGADVFESNGAAISGSPRQQPTDRSHLIRLNAAFFITLFDPSQGVVLAKPWYSVTVEGLENFTWGGVNMGFPTGEVGYGSPITYSLGQHTFFGGLQHMNACIQGQGWNFKCVSKATGPTAGLMPDVPVDNNGFGGFAFTGGDVTIRIYRKDINGNRTGDAIQTVVMNFPNATFPAPKLAPAAVENVTSWTGTKDGTKYNFRTYLGNGRLNANESLAKFSSKDTVRAVVATPGDIRLLACQKNPPKDLYKPHPNYFNMPAATTPNNGHRHAHMVRTGMGHTYWGATGGKLVNVSYPGYASQYTNNDELDTSTCVFGLWNSGSPPRDADVPSTTGVTQDNGVAADWDNGLANLKDGPYINKADEGDLGGTYAGYYQLEYTGTGPSALPGPTFYSPNRLVPSAAMFGSLPSGVFAKKNWQTLLFRPGPANHPGLGTSTVGGNNGPPYSTVPDHVLLDWFNMPVVEPYAISEPMSTAGRVNMNYQIVPFTYINRDTGIRAVLKSEQQLTVPDSSASTYKYVGNSSSAPTSNATNQAWRQPLNMEETLLGFRNRLTGKQDLFRSATEICDLHLVPTGATLAGMGTYWNTRKLVGDNSRERPYANIYPRLTTKSNTYTIHFRAQVLKKKRNSDAAVWTESEDMVTSEYRGSQTIERYIDPNNRQIPDYTDPAVTTPISNFYHIRVVQSKEFAP
ncbi:hypothetical protein DB346_23945 [Verrucomicrobia bacterium LW23]|nr:hypothetical protein DB346_23945 [Verrucomicrobia bacterium LW23]